MSEKRCEKCGALMYGRSCIACGAGRESTLREALAVKVPAGWYAGKRLAECPIAFWSWLAHDAPKSVVFNGRWREAREAAKILARHPLEAAEEAKR